MACYVVALSHPRTAPWAGSGIAWQPRLNRLVALRRTRDDANTIMSARRLHIDACMSWSCAHRLGMG